MGDRHSVRHRRRIADCGSGTAGFRGAGRYLGRFGGCGADRQRLQPRGPVQTPDPGKLRRNRSGQWHRHRRRAFPAGRRGPAQHGDPEEATDRGRRAGNRDAPRAGTPRRDRPAAAVAALVRSGAAGHRDRHQHRETCYFRPGFGRQAGRRGGGQLRCAGSVAAGHHRRAALHGRRDRQHDQPARRRRLRHGGGAGARRRVGAIVVWRGTCERDRRIRGHGPGPVRRRRVAGSLWVKCTDPRCRVASAEAGRAQGRREAAGVAAFLGIA